MTRKDFIVIADAIASYPGRSPGHPHTISEEQRDGLAEHFARRLAQTNPRFDHGRFRDACKPKGDR